MSGIYIEGVSDFHLPTHFQRYLIAPLLNIPADTFKMYDIYHKEVWQLVNATLGTSNYLNNKFDSA